MTLREKQSLFVQMVAKLIIRAEEEGYQFTLGEAYRPPELAELYAKQGRGIANSLHTKRLAIDLNLFLNGAFLETSEAHRPLGEFWKALDPNARWGGDFKKPDGNHYELTE